MLQYVILYRIVNVRYHSQSPLYLSWYYTWKTSAVYICVAWHPVFRLASPSSSQMKSVFINWKRSLKSKLVDCGCYRFALASGLVVLWVGWLLWSVYVGFVRRAENGCLCGSVMRMSHKNQSFKRRTCKVAQMYQESTRVIVCRYCCFFFINHIFFKYCI